ncbi:MAG: TlpA family protein disulfide reductase [Chloroflexi bacterium]|nr:TlpA family protein disulfide reductase [Chloroflexota bacterium]
MNANKSGGGRKRNGRSPLFILGGIILIGLALALLIFGNELLGKNEGQGSILSQIPAFDSAANQPSDPIQAGDEARDFVLNDADGNAVRLSNFDGRPLILNFWATWCGPCRVEMPDLQAAYDAHQEDGLVILAINREESIETVRAFFYDEMGLTFTPLLDADAEAARLYNVANYPTSVFVDREGTVTAVHLGLMVEEQIEGYLAETLQN